jgi:hypothetical protein
VFYLSESSGFYAQSIDCFVFSSDLQKAVSLVQHLLPDHLSLCVSVTEWCTLSTLDSVIALPIMNPDHHHSQEHGSGGYHEVHDQWASGNPSPYQSHHQSPVHEYTAFNFSGLPIEPMYVTTATMPPPQPRSHQQLQPLMVPPWPSQLTSNSTYHTPVYHHTPVSATTPVTTPMSAPPTTGRHSDRPRKTLTDADRRRMCKYAEEHPNVKQTEIGGKYRST